jgi:RNA polymerase sigma factor (sigma-70 family)
MTRGQSTPVQAPLVRLLTEGSMIGTNESQLLDRFLSRGDEEAFEAILTRYGPMVLAICRRILADPNDVDDAFQATFLVLLKKARSIRDRAVLGTWLHGVARRVAVRAQVNARRRRSREYVGVDLAVWNDQRPREDDLAQLRTVIDEEVARLADKYRSALVLCDLDGQSQEAAAAQLRCPVGTVKSRLSRARNKLRSRLSKRGILPSAGILAVSFAPEPASALPAELVRSTIIAAGKLWVERKTGAGAVSAAVAALVEGTLRSMTMSALKLAAIVLTAASVIVTGAGVLAYQTPVPKPAETTVPPQANLYAKGKAVLSGAPKPDQPKPEPVETKTNLVAGSDRSIASLAQARLQAAEKFLEKVKKIYLEQPSPLYTPEYMRSRALRVLEARRDADPGRANQIAALEDYLRFIRRVEAEEKARGNVDQLPLAEYYRLEAELWLAQARTGREPNISGGGAGSGSRPGSGAGNRPGTDPRSQALLVRLEEPIAMSFPNPTPLADVLQYIRQATAGPDHLGIQIHVDPVDPAEDRNMHEELMKTPITMDLEGVPLRRVLKLIADQLHMGYGIKDGMVTLLPPNMARPNWHDLMVMEESFPDSSPLATEVQRARRGELSATELEQLDERLKAIEEVTKRYRSIRMQGRAVNAPGEMNPGIQPPLPGQRAPAP